MNTDPDWDRVEALAEAAMLADQTVISGYDFGAGFKAGYQAAMIDAQAEQ